MVPKSGIMAQQECEKNQGHSRVNPCRGDTSSPDVSQGNALILVHSSRYALGAPGPKFSGLKAVPVNKRVNQYLHTIILIYKLINPSVLLSSHI